MNWFTSYVIMPLEVFNSRSIESAKCECMDVYKMVDTMSIDKFEELVEDSIVVIELYLCPSCKKWKLNFVGRKILYE
ncbi:hypothetical protein COJ48_04380 [Bacillus cereus]|uniref:hypothetical protein n=1 Tax=Bacillus paramycoides TaxID=2026194 RepID=UPI000BF6A8C2|nr:hypothetical protein [Bacillus paramycoides]MED1116156.1 hypothetical protein [Bacillus paramycoides]NWK68219.1 hypothetical protein [Bacillus paramycoides]PFM65899.1 hypothetical protein COJ48_04380 [Bacillus cereus]PGP84912.1 hypothetical protein CN997_10070 [Bacillus cereus]